MIVIGLTGGIASGKTTIMNFLKKKKFAVHDSDAVVKKIYSKPEPKFLSYLKKTNLKNSIKGNKIDKKRDNTIHYIVVFLLSISSGVPVCSNYYCG